MKRLIGIISCFFILNTSFSQYADQGSGTLKNYIWWFDWNGFSISNGAKKTFNTPDGLEVTIEFSGVSGPGFSPAIMNTWWGAVLHNLYNFSNPVIKPALINSYFTGPAKFNFKVTTTRNGVPTPFNFVAADAEGSDNAEFTVLKTSGTAWKTIDFFRNSSQTNNPAKNCGNQTVTLSETFSSSSFGQNPVLSTQAGASGELTIEATLTEINTGGMAVAFGIFAPVDRGDLPVSYGTALHEITFDFNNSCNFNPPYPSLTQESKLYIGKNIPDADGGQSSDDNSTGADEDGISVFTEYDKSGIYSLSMPVVNKTGTDAYLTGYCDLNQNGVFEASESYTATVINNSTNATIKWSVLPPSFPTTSNYAFRFRFSSQKSLSENPTGYAKDGEVEDYLIRLKSAVAAFTAPDTVCVNTSVSITNNSTDASTYFWNFCVADVNSTPTAVNLGNPGGLLKGPVFTDIVNVNGNNYVFVVNNWVGTVTRLDFGNSLLNTPVPVNLGNLGGVLPVAAENIQVVNNEGKWYAFIVGGDPQFGANPFLVKVEFGTDITNASPIATNWGNLGNMLQPVDFYMFKDGNNWFGLTVNANNNTITRFDFGISFANPPTPSNLGNIGNLQYPTGINPIFSNGKWYVFVTNETSNSITRLDFGNSLLNTPTAVNLGNPGNALSRPRDLYIMNFCSGTVGFVVNRDNYIVRLNFNNNLEQLPTATSIGNIGSLSYPHSFSKLFREGSDLFSFITNVDNQTITRLRFEGCKGLNIPNSTQAVPAPILYTTPGTYNINLTVDEGLPTQSSFCKQIVVMPKPIAEFSFTQDICDPHSVSFKNESNYQAVNWDFGNSSNSTSQTPKVIFDPFGDYDILLKISTSYGCAETVTKRVAINVKVDSLIKTRDTVMCFNTPFKLESLTALEYCWSPSAGLSDANIASPLITGPIPKTTYYLNALQESHNLITNGNFSAGNAGFASEYNYVSTNFTEGQYFVSSNVKAWNNNMIQCGDHTTGTGNMLLINGNPVPDIKVWKATIPVSPNTNYAFSTWIEALSVQNPAQLQFSINGKIIGDQITAKLPTCTWSQFYSLWNSGSATTAEISIVNKNTFVAGNDFALDDISFSELQMIRDSVTVTINEYPKITPLDDIYICPGTSATLDAKVTGATEYKWTPGAGLSETDVRDPTITPLVSNTYTLLASNEGCSANEEVTVNVLTPAECIPPVPSFIAPDTVCVNSQVNLQNTSVGGKSFFWNFCVADINSVPTAVNIGNPGGLLKGPVFTDIVNVNGNNYVFVVNNWVGTVTRLDFGNNLLNTPTAVDLGNLGGILPVAAENIQIINNGGKWYAFIVGGDPQFGANPFLVKVEFGTDITNKSPVAVNWGNLGNMLQPVDFFMFQDNNSWFGLTVNAVNNTITRFNFGTSFVNPPIAANLGNIGNLNYPTGINPIFIDGKWYVFVTNEANSSISRLDFGSSLLNTPTATIIGNPGNLLSRPRDLYIMKFCSELVGFVVNRDNIIVRLNFNNNIEQAPTATSLGNIGNLSYPHSFSKIFRDGSDLYSFITNVDNQTITRLRFEGCKGINIPNSTLKSPLPIVYTNPGTYNINLTINEGLPSQSTFCKQIVVMPLPSVDFTFEQDICNPHSVSFKNESSDYKSINWDFGNSTFSDEEAPTAIFNPYGTYSIKLKAVAEGGCADSITKALAILLKNDSIVSMRDTVLCFNGPFTLNSLPAFKYCWSPSAGLSATDVASPVIQGPISKTTYYVNALASGNNLIVNGDFTQGNTGFTSEYTNSQSSGLNAGVYGVRPDVRPWHSNLGDCRDHTSDGGNMMLVNGSQIAGKKVWSQKVAILPNTNYSFSTWLESLDPTFPAILQFYINGKLIGDVFNASSQVCNWKQFYSLWNSGQSTTADIAIVNQNTEPGGNDFALDDISFSVLRMVRDSITVTINENPEIDYNYNIPFCKSVQLSGTGIYTPSPIAKWNWSFADGQTANVNTLTHTYFKGGSYAIKLVATDMNSCKDSITKTIQLDTIKALINPDTMVCKNSMITLRGDGGTTYEWWPSSAMNIATASHPQVFIDKTTRFYLKVKNGIECENTDSVLITVKARPAFVKPPDLAMCKDSTIQLQGYNGDSHHYLWSPSESLDDPKATNPMASPEITSQYKVIITEALCGYDTAYAILVTVNPNPTVTVAKQRDIDCINPTAPLTASGTGSTYSWTPAAGVDFPLRQNVTASVDSTTTFVLKNTNEFSCSAYDSVRVIVTNTAKPVFIMPNAFTPNNDGVNDCFGIKHWGNVTVHEFSIFNRWGEKVFSTKNPRECWNGMYKGQLQPSGGFVYVIKAKSFCGELVRTGTLVLVR